MAVTVATRRSRGTRTFWEGGNADGAAQNIIDTSADNDSGGDCSKNDYYCFYAATGTFSVQVSDDGTNWSDDMALTDLNDTGGALVTTSVANHVMGLQGVWRHIRVVSDGATTGFWAAASRLSS